jgi:hypothetical protein
MSGTSTTSTLRRAGPAAAAASTRGPTVRQRAAAFTSAAIAAILGVLPHVLHHAGPLAGAALLAGTAGTLLFGAIGLVAAIPFLLRVHKRCGNWTLPGGLLALFAVVFSISAFVIGPAINGDRAKTIRSGTSSQTAPSAPAAGSHAAHHQ